MTTIVDKSGIHSHIIKYCMCTDAPTADIQLCQMGLFPASFSQPKTAFTIRKKGKSLSHLTHLQRLNSTLSSPSCQSKPFWLNFCLEDCSQRKHNNSKQ
ncbi:hypothetical protein C8R48DRAFT_605741 [Suillus tomentosus]|nr:hypothetical protein C8R48DRAFT_605741 [Suillus tomentosus]